MGISPISHLQCRAANLFPSQHPTNASTSPPSESNDMFTTARSSAPRIRLSLFRRYTTKRQTQTESSVLKQDPQIDAEASEEKTASSSALPPKPIPKHLIHRVTFIHGNLPQHLQVLDSLRQVSAQLPFCLHPQSQNLGHAPHPEPRALHVEARALPTLEDVHSMLDFDGMRFVREAHASLPALMASLARDPACMRLPIVIDWTQKRVYLERLARLYPKTVRRESKIQERLVLKWLIDRILVKAERGLWNSRTENGGQARAWFERVQGEVRLRKALFVQVYGQPFDR
ncbi:hypothetical protein IW261DRAFT_1456481 [Armillaria novae-zelandiae]|uniref:Uncharacterized protein n=1 Tax=Armillaria novae-zelandiae TaxID=153914 RepID=A0AA39PIF7_9AGAR|nr:hypothetical protein IW261DRAFT_1456481 [Armillaria novae-zelandiae]